MDPHVSAVVEMIHEALSDRSVPLRGEIASWGHIEQEPGVIGIEFADGGMVFVRVEPA